jgi:hypothetical protein
MIVFPVRRTFELNAVTASSSVEMLPIFVHSLQSRVRRMRTAARGAV